VKRSSSPVVIAEEKLILDSLSWMLGRHKFEAFCHHFVSGIFLQTMTVCPVLESIRVVTGSQRHDTVFAFSRLVTTQCSMTSAVGGGIWLRTGAGGGGGGGASATGFFLAAQPARPRIQNKNKMEQNFLITDRTLPRAQYTAAWVTEPIASGVPACPRP
jgi:hypothetical protein